MVRMSRGADGVLEPRLRLAGVMARGAAYGVIAALCVAIAANWTMDLTRTGRAHG